MDDRVRKLEELEQKVGEWLILNKIAYPKAKKIFSEVENYIDGEKVSVEFSNIIKEIEK